MIINKIKTFEIETDKFAGPVNISDKEILEKVGNLLVELVNEYGVEFSLDIAMKLYINLIVNFYIGVLQVGRDDKILDILKKIKEKQLEDVISLREVVTCGYYNGVKCLKDNNMKWTKSAHDQFCKSMKEDVSIL